MCIFREVMIHSVIYMQTTAFNSRNSTSRPEHSIFIYIITIIIIIIIIIITINITTKSGYFTR